MYFTHPLYHNLFYCVNSGRLNSFVINAKHTIVATKSATGPAYITPSIPRKSGRIINNGKRKRICLVRDIKIPFFGFPIAVKKFAEIGCKKQRKIKNRKIRKNFSAKSKYSDDPFPKNPIICLGKS